MDQNPPPGARRDAALHALAARSRALPRWAVVSGLTILCAFMVAGFVRSLT